MNDKKLEAAWKIFGVNVVFVSFLLFLQPDIFSKLKVKLDKDLQTRIALSELYQDVNRYFGSQNKKTYPANPRLFQFDNDFLNLEEVPETWQEFNEGKFIFKQQAYLKFKGSKKAVLFIENPADRVRKDSLLAIFEDGHIDIIPYK